MSKIFETLQREHSNNEKILIRHRNFKVKYKDIFKLENIDLKKINCGDVVALIGDYNSFTIKVFLKLVDKKAIILPLTKDTKATHNYYFDKACVDYIIENKKIINIKAKKKK